MKQKHKIHTDTHRHTCTQTQPFYSSLDFVWDNPGEPVPEETFTHSHLSWSSVIPYLLPPSTAIHGIIPVQFTCLTVFFHNLAPSFLWSTSYSIHFFTQQWRNQEFWFGGLGLFSWKNFLHPFALSALPAFLTFHRCLFIFLHFSWHKCQSS